MSLIDLDKTLENLLAEFRLIFDPNDYSRLASLIDELLQAQKYAQGATTTSNVQPESSGSPKFGAKIAIIADSMRKAADSAIKKQIPSTTGQNNLPLEYSPDKTAILNKIQKEINRIEEIELERVQKTKQSVPESGQSSDENNHFTIPANNNHVTILQRAKNIFFNCLSDTNNLKKEDIVELEKLRKLINIHKLYKPIKDEAAGLFNDIRSTVENFKSIVGTKSEPSIADIIEISGTLLTCFSDLTKALTSDEKNTTEEQKAALSNLNTKLKAFQQSIKEGLSEILSEQVNEVLTRFEKLVQKNLDSVLNGRERQNIAETLENFKAMSEKFKATLEAFDLKALLEGPERQNIAETLENFKEISNEFRVKLTEFDLKELNAQACNVAEKLVTVTSQAQDFVEDISGNPQVIVELENILKDIYTNNTQAQDLLQKKHYKLLTLEQGLNLLKLSARHDENILKNCQKQYQIQIDAVDLSDDAVQGIFFRATFCKDVKEAVDAVCQVRQAITEYIENQSNFKEATYKSVYDTTYGALDKLYKVKELYYCNAKKSMQSIRKVAESHGKAGTNVNELLERAKSATSEKIIFCAFIAAGITSALFGIGGIGDLNKINAKGVASLILLFVSSTLLISSSKIAQNKNEEKEKKYSFAHSIFIGVIPGVIVGIAACIATLRIFDLEYAKIWQKTTNETLIVGTAIAICITSFAILTTINYVKEKKNASSTEDESVLTNNVQEQVPSILFNADKTPVEKVVQQHANG